MRSHRSLASLGVVLATLSSLTVLTGGCMVGPNYARPDVEQPMQFKSAAGREAAPAISADWWTLYREPDLDQLIATAHRSNQTIRQAVARVDQARALARVAGG